MAVFINFKNFELNLEMLVQVEYQEDKNYEITCLHFQNESQTLTLKQLKTNRDKEIDRLVDIVKKYIDGSRWEYL